jgi:GNAT superfamily N-acetyltransferase
MITIQRLRELPPGLSELVAESERFGFRFLRRLVEEWASGANRFDGPGEALFAARADGRWIGLCGLNTDPYCAEPGVGRVRHLYVATAFRRRRVGRQLVEAVVGAARGVYGRLRLRTHNPEAARFYETLGFRPCQGQAECTHVLELPGPAS